MAQQGIEVYRVMTTPVKADPQLIIHGGADDIRQFRKFIHNLLAFTVTKEYDPRKDMTTAQMMSYWVTAFTHKSVDAANNYDALEFLGDVELKAAFRQYLFIYHRTESSHLFTTLNNWYMSKRYQHVISGLLNFEPWVRISGDAELNDHVMEDVLEAFFGALSRVGHLLYTMDRTKYLYPQELTLRFFAAYFAANPIDLRKGRYVPKTELISFWNFFTGEVGKQYRLNRDGMVELTDKFYDGIRAKTDRSVGDRLVRELKSLRFPAGTSEDDQTDEIMKLFDKAGIDEAWRKDQNQAYSFKGDTVIEKLAKDNGFTRFIIEPDFQDGQKYYRVLAQSVGEKGNSKSKLVATFGDIRGVKQEARKVILNEYSR